MKYVSVLIVLASFTGYIQLQHANGKAINTCLDGDVNVNCTCCRSGYRGQACNDKCQHCLTRYVSGKCTYYCETGYYGVVCDTKCPKGCVGGFYGGSYCKEENGEPVCVNGCSDGYCGRQCNQTCDSNCLEMKCFQMDGTCLHCKDSHHYGDHCNIACSRGCLSGKCSRSGLCIEGCKSGFYGEECLSVCGSLCAERKCTSDNYYGYNCTEGCLSGYTGTDCLIRCPHPCKECNQQSGECTSCVANYVQTPDTKDCIKVIPNAKFPWNKIVIMTAIGSIIILVVVVVVVIFVRRIKGLRKQTTADYLSSKPKEVSTLLSQKIYSDDINGDDSAFDSDNYNSDGGRRCHFPKH